MRFLWILLFGLLSLVGLPIAVCALIMILQADVDHSRFFAFGVLAAYVLFVTILKGLLSDSGQPKLWALLYALIAIGFFLASWSKSPDGVVPTDDKSGYEFAASKNRRLLTWRWHPANLVSECDQAHLAVTLSKLLRAKRAPVSPPSAQAAIRDVYEHIRYAAPTLANFGAATAPTYMDWLGYPQRIEHRVTYFPSANNRVPAFLVLHGGQGNLQANLWLLKPLADSTARAIVAPTNGAGHWETTSGMERVETTMAEIRKESRINTGRLILVAFGSAGLGAGAIAEKHPDWFQGMILIGAPLDANVIAKPGFVSAWRGKPIFIAHGTADPVTPIERVEKAAAALTALGAVVRLHKIEGADHYLAFTEAKNLSEALRAWIAPEAPAKPNAG